MPLSIKLVPTYRPLITACRNKRREDQKKQGADSPWSKKGGPLRNRREEKKRHIAAHITFVKTLRISAFSPFLLSGNVWYSMYVASDE